LNLNAEIFSGAAESPKPDGVPSDGGAPEVDEALDAAYWRAGIVNDFRVWLDEFCAEADASGPPAKDEESAPDLFALFGELAALRQETRGLARAAHQNGMQIETLAAALRSETTAQTAALSHAASDLKIQVPTARREAQTAVLTEILNVLDGVDNTLRAFLARPVPSWPWRAPAMKEREEAVRSMRMIADKINDALRRLNVAPLAEPGQEFNPRFMRAVAVTERGDASPGTVTEIVRQGYRKDDQILQIAEVEVNKQ